MGDGEEELEEVSVVVQLAGRLRVEFSDEIIHVH